MANAPKNSPFQTSRADYFAGLGELIHTFAQVEAQLQYALWEEAGVSSEVAKAIFSGVRLDQGKDYINRLTDALGRPRDPLLARGFAQLTALNKARNDIVHYGARFEAGLMQVSTEIAAHTPDRIRITPISKEILEAMISDLLHIKWIIQIHMIGLQRQTRDHARWVSEATERPWRYTPPQPPSPERPIRDKPARQSRQCHAARS